MSGVISAISAVAGLASSFMGGSPKASGSAANSEVDNSAASARKARSQLLETAGASSGDPLAAGSVGGGTGTIFGN